MTRPQPAESGSVRRLAGADTGPTTEQVANVAEHVGRLTRAVERSRLRFLAAARHDAEGWAYVLLKTIASCGPVRAGTLAERLGSDPSTVSRQIAALVKDGIIERQADPADGRASLLVLTDKGRAVHDEHLQHRDRHFAQMLEGWSERDARRFASLLARFTDQYEIVQGNFWAEIDAKRRTAAPGEES